MDIFNVRINALKHLFSFFALCLFGQLVFCQKQLSIDSIQECYLKQPKYLELGVGLSYSYFRDFATSPIFYKGYSPSISLAYQRHNTKNESRFGFHFRQGNYDFQIRNEYARANLQAYEFQFKHLVVLSRFSNSKWITKVGGEAIGTINLRSNSVLNNAGFGAEAIYNLMLSAKVERDVSRKTTKQGKFLFINYNWKPRRRLLTYQFNTGLLNGHYRNGYAYVHQQRIINEENWLSDYKHTIGQGLRFSSRLDYTLFFRNANAVQFSYLWDAYSTREENTAFEFAAHLIQFSLLIGLN